MPVMEGLEVYRSPVHGYGIRTTRPFEKGATLIYGDGVLFHEDDDFDDEYALIVPAYDETGKEIPSMYWDLACQSRWINHSCDPNTEVDTKFSEDGKRVIAWWTALRDIPVGEELAYDYSFSGHLAIPCHCKAALCRGLIVDPDEADLIPEQYKHLFKQATKLAV